MSGLHRLRKFEPSRGARFSVPGKIDIRDYPEHGFLVFLEIGPGFFISRAEQNLGPGAHAQSTMREIHPFVDKPLGVAHHLNINNRQKRGVIEDVVLDHDDGLNAEGVRVVRHIHPVFDGFDHRED